MNSTTSSTTFIDNETDDNTTTTSTRLQVANIIKTTADTNSNSKLRVCDGCGKAGHRTNDGKPKPLLRCSRCKQCWYHNSKCQRAHFPHHRAVCRTMSLAAAAASLSSSNNTPPPSMYSCRTHPLRGRCMIATRFLPHGTRLLEQQHQQQQQLDHQKLQHERSGNFSPTTASSTTTTNQVEEEDFFQPIVPPVLTTSERSSRCSYCFATLNEECAQYDDGSNISSSSSSSAVVVPIHLRPIRHAYCSKLCLSSGVGGGGYFREEEESIARWWLAASSSVSSRRRINANGSPPPPPAIQALTLLLYRIVQQIYREDDDDDDEEQKQSTTTKNNTKNNVRARMRPLAYNPQDLTHEEITFRRIIVQTTFQLLQYSNTTTTTTTTNNNNNKLTQDELTTLLSQIIQNAFSITDDENDLNSSIGLGLYTSASIMNHSCQPNAVQTFRYGMEGCCPRLIVTAVVGSGGDGGGGVAAGEEIFIAYNDVMQVKERRRDELWNDYKFWCDCVRCGGTTTVSGAEGGCGSSREDTFTTTTSSNGNEGGGGGLLLSYDELTRRLRCPTTSGCLGYGVSDCCSSAGEVVVEEEQDETMRYRCNICGRSDSFNSMATMRDRSLQVVDDFWARRQPTNSSTQSGSNSQWSTSSNISSRARILQEGRRGTQHESTPSLTLLSDSAIIDKLQSSYESMKKCCSHLSSWYVQYTGDALVRALLDRAATTHSDQNHHPSSNTDQEITTEAMGHYTQAHSILEELNKGCLLSSSSSSSSYSNGSSSHHAPSSSSEGLHPRQRPQLLSPLSVLQNRYRAAKLELFLNPDPRKAISELQDLLREYLVYYPSEHEWIKGLRRCIQSGFQ